MDAQEESPTTSQKPDYKEDEDARGQQKRDMHLMMSPSSKRFDEETSKKTRIGTPSKKQMSNLTTCMANLNSPNKSSNAESMEDEQLTIEELIDEVCDKDEMATQLSQSKEKKVKKRCEFIDDEAECSDIDNDNQSMKSTVSDKAFIDDSDQDEDPSIYKECNDIMDSKLTESKKQRKETLLEIVSFTDFHKMNTVKRALFLLWGCRKYHLFNQDSDFYIASYINSVAHLETLGKYFNLNVHFELLEQLFTPEKLLQTKNEFNEFFAICCNHAETHEMINIQEFLMLFSFPIESSIESIFHSIGGTLEELGNSDEKYTQEAESIATNIEQADAIFNSQCSQPEHNEERMTILLGNIFKAFKLEMSSCDKMDDMKNLRAHWTVSALKTRVYNFLKPENKDSIFVTQALFNLFETIIECIDKYEMKLQSDDVHVEAWSEEEQLAREEYVEATSKSTLLPYIKQTECDMYLECSEVLTKFPTINDTNLCQVVTMIQAKFPLLVTKAKAKWTKMGINIPINVARYSANFTIQQINAKITKKKSNVVDSSKEPEIEAPANDLSRIQSALQIDVNNTEDRRVRLLPETWLRDNYLCKSLVHNASISCMGLVIFHPIEIQLWLDSNLKYNQDESNVVWRYICGKHILRAEVQFYNEYGECSNDVDNVLIAFGKLGRRSQKKRILGNITNFLQNEGFDMRWVGVYFVNEEEYFSTMYCEIYTMTWPYSADNGEGRARFCVGMLEEKVLQKAGLMPKTGHGNYKVLYDYIDKKEVITQTQVLALITEVSQMTPVDNNDNGDITKPLIDICKEILSDKPSSLVQNIKGIATKIQIENAFVLDIWIDNKVKLAYAIWNNIFTAMKEKDEDIFNVDRTVLNWNFETRGEWEKRASWLQKDIFQFLFNLRSKRTTTQAVLVVNRISPATFTNEVVDRLVLGEYRKRTLIFTGEERKSGKTTLLMPILEMLKGVRMVLDFIKHMDAMIMSTDKQMNGCIVIEDLTPGTLRSADQRLRSLCDGCDIVMNRKYQTLKSGTWGTVAITTNVNSKTLFEHNFLQKRYSCIKFTVALDKMNKKETNRTITERDMSLFLFRNLVFPKCNQINSKRKTCFGWCTGTSISSHHPTCPLLCEMESAIRLHYQPAHMDINLPRIKHHGLITDLSIIEQVRLIFYWKKDIMKGPSFTELTSDKAIGLKAEVDRYFDHVVIPFCKLINGLGSEAPTEEEKAFTSVIDIPNAFNTVYPPEMFKFINDDQANQQLWCNSMEKKCKKELNSNANMLIDTWKNPPAKAKEDDLLYKQWKATYEHVLNIKACMIEKRANYSNFQLLFGFADLGHTIVESKKDIDSESDYDDDMCI